MKKRIAVILLIITICAAAGTLSIFSGFRGFGTSNGLQNFSFSDTYTLNALGADSTAENIFTAQRINENANIAYMHVKQINAFYALDGLYFSDGENLYRDTVSVGTGADGMVFYKGTLLTCRPSHVVDSETKPSGIYSGDALLLQGSFSHITVLGDNLYAANTKKIELYKLSYDEDDGISLVNSIAEKIFNYSANIEYLCATSKAVYLKLNGSSSVFKISSATAGGGTDVGNIGSVDNLVAIAANPSAASPYSEQIFCLTNNQIVAYSADDILSRIKSLNHGGATLIAVGTNKIYLGIKDGGTYSVFTLPTSFNQTSAMTGFFASRSDADYFYKSPAGATSRFGNIYVADTRNNRISVLSANGITHIYGCSAGGASQSAQSYDEPKAVAVALNGDLYIAHQYTDSITSISYYVVTNNTSGKSLKLQHSDERALTIEKMLIGSNGNIYVLGVYNMTGESFAYSADSSLNQFSLLPFENPSAIGYKAGGEVLFYSGGAVRSLNGIAVTTCETLKDFSVDYMGKVFGVNTNGNLITVNNGETVNRGGKYDKVVISSVISTLCGYGDLLLLETETNSLKKIDAATAGVADMAGQFIIPDIENDKSAHIQTDDNTRAVASVKYETSLFSQPTEAIIALTLMQDTEVFIRYDVNAPEDMYFVVVEQASSAETTGKLYGGYVYRSMLNAPYPYVSPPKNTAHLVIDYVDVYKNVYKYPSVYAKTIGQFEKGESIKILAFATNNSANDKFVDTLGNSWVRVKVGTTEEGYMQELGLDYSVFSDKNPQPNYNATITDNAFLYTYNKDTGQYEIFDGYSFLKKNTRVEVKTPFDSSSKYTQVIFSIENDGVTEVIDIVCFVETKFVKFDGVDVLQIILICAAIIAIVLIIFLIIWMINKRRKRKYEV